MNILIFNWRDIKNSKSGGAEILTHEMAKRWVKKGHSVIQFSSEFDNSVKEEIVDGVKIIREGHPDARFLFSSVHFLAFKNYKKRFEGKIDVVIDEVHGLPFFTPWYVKEKKVVLICEVARELWYGMFGLFFGSLGRLVEKFYLNFIYKNIDFMTISDSSKEDLLKEGVNEKNITVLPMGLNLPSQIGRYEKEKSPILIFVGRISKSKGIEDAIKALRNISKSLPKVKLWIVGRGEEDYFNYLKKLAKRLKVEDKIVWLGFVSENKKFELLGRAHILLAPSIKEGWGLTVPEAAFAGTPSIVYNSPGLRDILKDSIFKIIVKSNTADSIAEEVIKLLKNKDFYQGLWKKRPKERDYSWDHTANTALKILKE